MVLDTNCCASSSTRDCEDGYTLLATGVSKGSCSRNFSYQCLKRTEKSGSIIASPGGKVTIAVSGFNPPSSKKVTLTCGTKVSDPVTYTICDIKPLPADTAHTFDETTTIKPDMTFSGITR